MQSLSRMLEPTSPYEKILHPDFTAVCIRLSSWMGRWGGGGRREREGGMGTGGEREGRREGEGGRNDDETKRYSTTLFSYW